MKIVPIALLSLLGLGPAFAKDCRVPHLPGVQVKAPPGCDAQPSKSEPGQRMKQEAGFIDLGNGTKVRISGRVRAEVGIRR